MMSCNRRLGFLVVLFLPLQQLFSLSFTSNHCSVTASSSFSDQTICTDKPNYHYPGYFDYDCDWVIDTHRCPHPDYDGTIFGQAYCAVTCHQCPHSVSSDTISVDTTTTSSTTACYEPGQDIQISITNRTPRKDDWVGIYPLEAFSTDTNSQNSHHLGDPLLWLWVCGTQSDFCKVSYTVLIFGSQGPDETGTNSFPLPPGRYKAVLIRRGSVYTAYAESSTFSIDPPGIGCHGPAPTPPTPIILPTLAPQQPLPHPTPAPVHPAPTTPPVVAPTLAPQPPPPHLTTTPQQQPHPTPPIPPPSSSSCSSDSDCSSAGGGTEYYCMGGTCRPNGDCRTIVDCINPSNIYPVVACVGYLKCYEDQGVCGKVCSSSYCPPGRDPVNCFAAPCDPSIFPITDTCLAQSPVSCVDDYCGGCNAIRFNAKGNQVCTTNPPHPVPVPTFLPSPSQPPHPPVVPPSPIGIPPIYYECDDNAIITDKNCYERGEPIVVHFQQCLPQIDDWIAVYYASEPSQSLWREYRFWVWACDGTQSHHCSRSSGTVTFDENPPDESAADDFPLEPGQYTIHMIRRSIPPYQSYIQSNSFTVLDVHATGEVCPGTGPAEPSSTNAPHPVVPPTNAPHPVVPPTNAPHPVVQPSNAPHPVTPTSECTITMSTEWGCYYVGESITVTFTNNCDDSAADDWIAIYPYNSNDGTNLHALGYPFLWFWSCGNQSCRSPLTTTTTTSSAGHHVIFGYGGANERGTYYFPLPPGRYIAVFIRGVNPGGQNVAVAQSNSFQIVSHHDGSCYGSSTINNNGKGGSNRKRHRTLDGGGLLKLRRPKQQTLD